MNLSGSDNVWAYRFAGEHLASPVWSSHQELKITIPDALQRNANNTLLLSVGGLETSMELSYARLLING